MSGICGLFNLDDAPVADADLRSMVAMLKRRGPDGTAQWQRAQIGLGHTMLATTPESQFEQQPFTHAETGCVITADIRLDNRGELSQALDVRRPLEFVGDAELILLAYLAWGENCLDRLLGDFAFAIWDPRHQSLFCARDHFGMRALYYHHQQGRHFVFASETRAILVLPQVPFQINDGRVADFLVPELEWVDYASTFFEEVYRLPPGHKAIVKATRLEITEYWHPQPGPELGQMSDDDYRQGFVEVLTESVEARLRAPRGTVGSMLSGGMDSGAVVAIAKEILNARDAGALSTFSASRRRNTGNPDDLDCPESRAIYAATSMSSLSPTLIHPDDLEDFYGPLTTDFDEPFDGVFMFLKAIFLEARNQGKRVLLDGGGGDVVLGEGSYIQRLIRGGQFELALSEILAENRYWNRGSAVPSLFHYARSSLIPETVKKLARGPRHRYRVKGYLKRSLISGNLAKSVRIEDRFERMRQIFPSGWTPDYAEEYCKTIWPNMTAGRERYARIAATTGMEARDPFMDKRVVEYCSRLPGRFRFRDGRPKAILRDIMADTLPTDVLWERRKPHIGWVFSEEVTKKSANRGELNFAKLEETLKGYVDSAALADAWRDYRDGGNFERIHYHFVLSLWLQDMGQRPVVADGQVM